MRVIIGGRDSVGCAEWSRCTRIVFRESVLRVRPNQPKYHLELNSTVSVAPAAGRYSFGTTLRHERTNRARAPRSVVVLVVFGVGIRTHTHALATHIHSLTHTSTLSDRVAMANALKRSLRTRHIASLFYAHIHRYTHYDDYVAQPDCRSIRLLPVV